MKAKSNPIRIRMRVLPLAVLSLLFAEAALAQDAKLIAEAKKDGKVVIYGSMEQDIFEGVRQSFEKKAGIPVECIAIIGAAARLRRVGARTRDHRAQSR